MPNDAVEKVSPFAHRAVNQNKYQSQTEDDIAETKMARYKHIDTSPRFLAVDLQRQLLPGTIEYALNHLLDHEIDLSGRPHLIWQTLCHGGAGIR